MPYSLLYPTSSHSQVAELVLAYFNRYSEVDTVLVVNSCARGQATPESDLDMAILLSKPTSGEDKLALESCWMNYARDHPVIRAFKQRGRFSALHLDVIDGQYIPTTWDDGGGPDHFEISIGNHIAYSAPISTPGPRYQQLRATWLPYYSEELQTHRLMMARDGCRLDLDFIPFYVRRELYFQAFDRLYKAYQEFLQALFIARRTYPLAYNKWIHEQVVNWLGLPNLYQQLPAILSVINLESSELVDKVHDLRGLLDTWCR